MYKEHNSLSTQDLQALDAAHHLHPFSEMGAINAKGSRIIIRGEGVYIWDSEGNKILDGMSGLWCTQIGNGRKEIAEAVLAQMNEISYYNTFFQCSHPAAARLSAMLADVAPEGFEHVFFTNSGSEANDTVFRMVRTYWNTMGKPEKKIILTRTNGYHGSTVLAANLGGMSGMHAQGGKEIDSIHHIAQPYWFGSETDKTPDEFGIEAANALEAAILEHGEENVGAFIAEPIQGAGGAIIPPETYWPRVKEILEKYDILFSADEVICGFGRTGEWFGSDFYGLKPDLMTIAKGVTSGYVPMGGVLVGSRVAPVIANECGEFAHGFTYSGHPVACAAAIANLTILQNEKVIDKVREDRGPYLQKLWKGLGDHPLVGETRMVGLIGALEICADKATRARFPEAAGAGTLCRDIVVSEGLVMRAVGDTMIIAPPLVLSHEEADELIAKATRALDLTQKELKAQGYL